MEQVLVDLLKEKPDFLLLGMFMLILIFTLLAILPIAMIARIIVGEPNLVTQLLNNPVVKNV